MPIGSEYLGRAYPNYSGCKPKFQLPLTMTTGIDHAQTNRENSIRSVRDERIWFAKEGGERAKGARRRSFSCQIQRKRRLLPQLWQGPYHKVVESPPWDPYQDLQITRPRSPRRPCYSVLTSLVLQTLIRSSRNCYVFYLLNSCRDNSKLCSCGGDRQIFYWDVATGRVIRKFRGHDSEVCLFLKTIWDL